MKRFIYYILFANDDEHLEIEDEFFFIEQNGFTKEDVALVASLDLLATTEGLSEFDKKIIITRIA